MAKWKWFFLSISEEMLKTLDRCQHQTEMRITRTFRTITKDGYIGSYRSLSAFLAGYIEGLGRRHRKTSTESIEEEC